MIAGASRYLASNAIAAAERWLPGGRAAIFCLHTLVHRGGMTGRISVYEDVLARGLEDLRRARIPIVTPAQGIAMFRRDPNARWVAFTFDDGHRSLFELAWPLFARYDAPFTVFLTTGLVDRDVPMWWELLETVISVVPEITLSDIRHQTRTPAEKESAYSWAAAQLREMSVDELGQGVEELRSQVRETDIQDPYGSALDWYMVRRMTESGLADFGSHSVTHRMMNGLSRDEIRRELEGSRIRIEQETGRAVEHFAYPFGQAHEIGPVPASLLKEAGFSAAFTTEARLVRASDLGDAFVMPRIMVSRRAVPAVFRAHLTGLPSALRSQERVKVVEPVANAV